MRVLQVVPSFYPAHVYGGPIQSLYHLCRHLARQGCEVKVLTTTANGPGCDLEVETAGEVELDGCFKVRYCRRNLLGSVSLPLLAHLPSYIRWAEVIHLTSVYSFPTIPALVLARLWRRPVVWSPRGSLQRWQGSSRPTLKAAWESMCRLVAPRRLALHMTSASEAAQSAARMPGTRTVVIPNGIHVPPGETRGPQSFVPQGVLRLVYIGRIHPIKGLENLLAACRILRGLGRMSWNLRIAGTGEPAYRRAIEERIRELELSSDVTMPGPVLGAEKDALLASADLLVLPSHSENFGIVVAEALAAGVPVIASRGTPWERVQDLGCGLWTPNDPDNLASAIEQAARMPLFAMGQAGRDWMRREFSWDQIARRMAELYSQIRPQPGRAIERQARPAAEKLSAG